MSSAGIFPPLPAPAVDVPEDKLPALEDLPSGLGHYADRLGRVVLFTPRTLVILGDRKHYRRRGPWIQLRGVHQLVEEAREDGRRRGREAGLIEVGDFLVSRGLDVEDLET